MTAEYRILNDCVMPVHTYTLVYIFNIFLNRLKEQAQNTEELKRQYREFPYILHPVSLLLTPYISRVYLLQLMNQY